MTPPNTAPSETLDAAPESNKARIILDAATNLLTSLAKGEALEKAAARSHGAYHRRLRRRRRLVLEGRL